MRPHSFANSRLHKELRLARKARWVGAALVCLAILNGWGVSQATAQDLVTVIPNSSTYDVPKASFGGPFVNAHAPFGSGGSCLLQQYISFYWPTGTPSTPSTMTIEKVFRLPVRADGQHVQAVFGFLLIDNNATVFWNDTLVQRFTSNGCPIEQILRVPANLLSLTDFNTLRIEVEDTGVESYFDLRVEATFD
jgi:hypothetical protein